MKTKKIIAFLLSFMLLFSLLPNGAAWAEDQDGVEISSPSDADEGEINEAEVEGLDVQEPRIQLRQLVSPLAAPVIKGAPGANQLLGGSNPDANPDQNPDQGQNQDNTLYINFDGATVDATNNKITFSIDNEDIVATVISDGLATWNGEELRIDRSYLEHLSFKMSDDFDGEALELYLAGPDQFSAALVYNSSTKLATFPKNLVGLPNGFNLGIKKKGEEPGPGPGPEGNSEAIIKLTGSEGSWNVKPMVEEDYDVKSDDGCSAPYSRYCYTTRVSINEGQRTEGLNQYNKNADVSKYGKQYVRFDYNEKDKGKVTLNFSHNWADKITYLKINDEEFTKQLPDYSDKATWLSYFKDQGVSFDIEVPLPMPLPEEEKDNPEDPDPYMEEGKPVFNIEITSEPITEEECYIGNFGWSKDDYFSPEGENPSDLYIGHCSLILVSAQLDLGNGKTKMWDLGGIEDTGAEVKNDLYPYAHFQMNRPSRMASEDEIPCSEMVIPTDSWVTMKIVPEPGYQVKSFEINGNSVKVGAEASVFSFKVSKGNFHIGAHVERQTNDSKVDSKVVKGAALLEISDEDLDAGTARLYVSDSDLTEEKQAEFEAEAAEEGLTIEDILDISVAQVFFKGTGNPDDVWANPKEDLDEPALLGIQLEGDYTGKDVEFVHNIHDGEEFETITPVEFDRANNIAYVEADSFSSYAIATKPISSTSEEEAKEATVTPAKKAEVKSTKPATADNFNIMLIGAIVIVSAAGIVFVVRRKRMIGK